MINNRTFLKEKIKDTCAQIDTKPKFSSNQTDRQLPPRPPSHKKDLIPTMAPHQAPEKKQRKEPPPPPPPQKKRRATPQNSPTQTLFPLLNRRHHLPRRPQPLLLLLPLGPQLARRLHHQGTIRRMMLVDKRIAWQFVRRIVDGTRGGLRDGGGGDLDRAQGCGGELRGQPVGAAVRAAVRAAEGQVEGRGHFDDGVPGVVGGGAGLRGGDFARVGVGWG